MSPDKPFIKFLRIELPKVINIPYVVNRISLHVFQLVGHPGSVSFCTPSQGIEPERGPSPRKTCQRHVFSEGGSAKAHPRQRAQRA